MGNQIEETGSASLSERSHIHLNQILKNTDFIVKVIILTPLDTMGKYSVMENKERFYNPSFHSL